MVEAEHRADWSVHTVRRDEKVCANRFEVVGVVAQHGSHARVVLFEGQQLRAIAHLAAEFSGMSQQDRFQLALRAVLRSGLWTELGHAGEEGVDVERLPLVCAVERRLDDYRRDTSGHCADLVADAESAKDLQGAEAQVARFRVDKDLTPLLHQKRRDPVFGEQCGRGEPSDTCTDNEHGDATVNHAITPSIS